MRPDIVTEVFFVMAEPVIAFSDHVAVLVERVSASIVAVHGGGRWSSSGIHWRPGVIVTAEEALERDEEPLPRSLRVMFGESHAGAVAPRACDALGRAAEV